MEFLFFKERQRPIIFHTSLTGLRAATDSKRCAAIEKVPSVFERSPFPIYVNAICLRLADAISAANASNFVRYQIVAVLDAHRAHLPKVIDQRRRRAACADHYALER